MNRIVLWWVVSMVLCPASGVLAQGVGGIRGVVYDKDFEVPLFGAQALISETGGKQTTTEDGHYVFEQVAPGTYTLVFSKEGFTRQVSANVVVQAGQLTDLDVYLSGEFTEMEEFVVQDLNLGGASEIQLLQIQMTAPSIMNSISSDMMSQAGAADAASALKLVSGATVDDGKYAVVRGLPDRYVNSQINGVRLPTADADKRAVQLDQFPSSLIESIQVSKTFTPDQQGDASGGAVNLVLKGIPEESVLKVKVGTKYNSQVGYGHDFLSSEGGGVNFLGLDDRDIPTDGQFGGTMGVSRDDAPLMYNWSMTAGGKHALDNGLRLGAIGTLYYKHDASYYEGGQHNVYRARSVGGTYEFQPFERYGYTDLYDVTEGADAVQWGALGVVGAEVENHSLTLLYMRTQLTQDKATLMEDTRGSLYRDSLDIEAPYRRNETLQYTERSQSTLQLRGKHTLELPEFDLGPFVTLSPEIDWTVAHSEAGLDQPDKRSFRSTWTPGVTIGSLVIPDRHSGDDPSGSGEGYAQRLWKEITEDGDQFSANGKLPFKQWTGDEGYVKVGLFHDRVKREYGQESFAYDPESEPVNFFGPWESFWSNAYVGEGHTITASDLDVDYSGDQEISAWYYMVDMPLNSIVKVVGGMRYESTDLQITNHPESDNAQYLPPGGTGWTRFGPEADVSFSQDDTLPSIGLEVTPWEPVKLRATYSETVARQTFKELSPVMQMEYVGADIFVGNPQLRMSGLKNYDLRADYTPYPGGLLSASWFHKDVKDPIEYVQAFQASLYFTTPTNYPEGQLDGFEFEIRQSLDRWWSRLEGFSVGANATLIDSEVTLPDKEQAAFTTAGVPRSTRDMTAAPEYLYNFNLTYEHPQYHTQVGLFYTVKGDTLVAGGVAPGGGFVPDIYEKEYGTLNLSVSQPFGERLKVALQAKNLTDPEIQRVYRSDYMDTEAVRSSYTKGIDVSLSMEYKF